MTWRTGYYTSATGTSTVMTTGAYYVPPLQPGPGYAPQQYVVTTGGTGYAPRQYVVTTGGTSWPQPEPVPRSALDWLDAEVEDTCKIARAA